MDVYAGQDTSRGCVDAASCTFFSFLFFGAWSLCGPCRAGICAGCDVDAIGSVMTVECKR